MKTLGCLTIGLLLALTLASVVPAGQLTDNLQAQVLSHPADQILSVWIELRSDRTTPLLAAALADQPLTRAERHRRVLAHLQTNNPERQRELVAALRRMEAAGQAHNIKAHWLVNVIEAEVAAGVLTDLARRDDIDMIYAPPRLTAIVPDKSDAGVVMSAGVSENLTFINADDAWAAGYTGVGRLVCTFDTGVDGDHQALAGSWKGNDGNFAAAWLDRRYDGQALPRTIPNCGYTPCNTNHGTHTLGSIVGRDPSTGDTTGVAPGARWISAAVIDITGTSIIDAFEWAADPDGDLNSLEDVPDVINHSWGVSDVGCQSLFFDMIDATEALGIVNIFAAGNEGSGAATIRNPADRALDSIDCFAVGNVDARSATPVVYSSSSRGPSDCNGAIKPNVTAPGVSIRSTWPGGSYNTMTGTSMAAPQVCGLVALMRQKNPNATVDQIKTAILTTARDFIYSLPDNDYGWGVVDCMAALNALPVDNLVPNVQVYAFDHPPIVAGDTVRGTIVLRNIGNDVTNLSAVLSGAEPLMTVLAGSADFGAILTDDTVRSADQIEVVVSDLALEGSILSLDLNLTGSGAYSQTRKLCFLVEPRLERAVATHDVGLIRFSLTSFGSYGLGDDSFFPAGGEGFTFEGSPDYLYEGGLIIGADAAHVSDGLRNATGELDGDFGVLPGGNLTVIDPGPAGSQQITARFGDHRAENPLGLEITQHSFAYPDYPNDDFIILRYIITNTQPFAVDGLYVGLYLDWDVVNWLINAGGFNVFDEFVWIARNDGGSMIEPRGAMLLEGPLATGLTSPGTLVTWDDNGDGFTEAEKYWALTNGTVSDSFYINSSTDLIQLIAAGPLSLSTGQIDTVAFALLASNDLSGMTDASDRARDAYVGLVTDVDDDPPGSLPDGFVLHQNYPNPFNPTTTISFVLPRKSDYRLSIYNIAGQKVTEFAGQGRLGVNRIVWEAEGMASGVYLYKLTVGDHTAGRKMLLLR